MSGNALVILNPVAGRGRARALWERLTAEAIPGLPAFRVHETSGPGDAAERSAAWAASGENGAIIAVGGDGTLHEVVNGLERVGRRVPLAIIPAGTGNDFARNAGLPPLPERTLRALAAGHTRRADLGGLAFREAGGGPPRQVVFVNSASVGVSPSANRYAQRIGKVVPGRLRYSLGGAWALLAAPRKRYRLSGSGEALAGKPLNITLANGASFGGGLRISPGSSVFDGILDLVVIGDIGLVRSLWALARLSRGGHVTMAGVSATAVHEAVGIASDDGPILLEADGHEYRAEGEVTITPVPGGVTLVFGG